MFQKSLNISNIPTVLPVKDNNTSNNTHFLLFPPVQKNVVNSEINLQTLDGELTPKKVLAYLAVPSVFYIQLLRARLGRVKRDNSDNHWEKIRSLSTETKSSLGNSQTQRPQSEQNKINNSSKAINQTNVKDQIKNRTSNINFEIKTGYVNTSKIPRTENKDQELQQDSSHRKRFEQKRLYHTHPFQSKSSESIDGYKYDYIPTTTYDEGEKRGADYSLFDNPVYNDYDDFYDTEAKENGEEEEEEEKKLEIIDVHDEHDLDYEYVPQNVSTSREPTEEMNENQHTNNSPEHIVNDKENSNFKSNSENDKSVKYHNPFYDSLFKSEFVEQLFPQSVTKTNDGYIKEPLAGPNATRGFGHDFKVQRGNKVKGNVVTQLPNRFPTVGYFNTKQVHKLLQQPQLVTNNTNDGTRLKNFTKTVALQPVPSFDDSSDDHYGPQFGSLEAFSGYEDQPESIEDSPEYVDFDFDESVTEQKLRTNDNFSDFIKYPSRTQDEISGSNDEFQRGEFSIKKPLLIKSKTNNEQKRNIPKFSENDSHKLNKYNINRSNQQLISNIDNESPSLYIVYPTNGKILNTEIQSKDAINKPSIPKRIYKSTKRDEYEEDSDERDVTQKIFKNDNESENNERKPGEGEEHEEATRNEEGHVEEEEEDTGIYRTISKILEGKDRISREKNILEGPKPQVYNNYWTLEYSFPKNK